MLAGCGGSQSGVTPQGVPVTAQAPGSDSSSNGFASIFSFGGYGGANPAGALIVVGNKHYGTASAGPGNVYDVTRTEVEHVLYTFSPSSGGGQPFCPLLYLDGVFYGTTANGGEYHTGSAFAVTKSGQAKTLANFYASQNGREPLGGLVYFHHALYGTTIGGGTYDGGTAFRLTLSGKLTTIHEFGAGADGGDPSATMTVFEGALYGTTAAGGSEDVGTVFKMDDSGNERVLYSFGSKSGVDGATPLGTLIGVNGKLYGTTLYGGYSSGYSSYSDGVVFEVSKSGNERILHAFKGSDGANPAGGLVFLHGEFYGTTTDGGSGESSYQYGTVFKMSPSGHESVIHSFDDYDGNRPASALTVFGGALYGTTWDGGQYSYGTVFRMYPH
jgi:uncharacterized repeat protein (TIGR03803 family)